MKWPWSRDSFIWVYANGASRFPVQISESPSLPHPLILSPKRRTMLLAKEGGAKWWQLHWDFNTTEFFLRIVRRANSVGKSGKRLRWWRVQMVTKKSILCELCIWLVNRGLLIDNWHPCFCISSLVSGMNFPAAFLAIFSTTLPKTYTFAKKKAASAISYWISPFWHFTISQPPLHPPRGPDQLPTDTGHDTGTPQAEWSWAQGWTWPSPQCHSPSRSYLLRIV